jgi:hypothetical protein
MVLIQRFFGEVKPSWFRWIKVVTLVRNEDVGDVSIYVLKSPIQAPPAEVVCALIKIICIAGRHAWPTLGEAEDK